MIIRLGIVDDHQLFRDSLTRALNEEARFEVVFTAANGEELLQIIEDQPVDVLLLDLNMPYLNGKDSLIQLKKRNINCKVIVVSMHYEPEDVMALSYSGANAYIPKDYDLSLLVKSIIEVHENGYYFDELVPKETVAKIIEEGIPTYEKDELILSTREIQIIQSICKDMTAKEIAEQLGIDRRTVEGHKQRLLKKLNVKSSIGLVTFAIENNLFSVKR